MDWLMLSFAAGSEEMHGAGKRLIAQAKDSGLFAKSLLITEDSLFKFNEDGSKLKSFIDSNQRGYGLFAWKSYIFNLAMQGAFGKYDGIFYADAGCELLWNKRSLKYFKELMDLTSVAGILTFSTPIPEYVYTKKDALDLLNNPEHIYSPQIEATVIFASPHSDCALELVGRWWDISSIDNFKYLVDSEDEQEMDEFIDHRHDQSILSILLKNYGVISLPESTPRYSKKNISLLHYLVFTPWPIWAIRNRTSVTRLRRWQNNGVISLILTPLFQNRLRIFKVYRFVVHVKFAVIHRLRKISRSH
jgi:hypothetical protein